MRQLATLLVLGLAVLLPAAAVGAKELSARDAKRVSDAEALEARARSALEGGRAADAEKLALQAVDLKRKAYRRHPRHPGFGTAYLVLAEAQLRHLAGPAPNLESAIERVPAQREGPSLSLLERAYQFVREAHGAAHPLCASSALTIAAIHEARDYTREAIRWGANALESLGPADQVDDVTRLAQAVARIAGQPHVRAAERSRIAFFQLGADLARAIPYAERLVALRGETGGDAGLAHRYLASLLLEQPGRTQDCLAHAEHAIRLLEPAGDRFAFERKQASIVRCLCLLDDGDLAGARAKEPALLDGTARPTPGVIAAMVKTIQRANAERTKGGPTRLEDLALGPQHDPHQVPVWPAPVRRLAVREANARMRAARKDVQALREGGLALLATGDFAGAMTAYVDALSATKDKAARADRHAAVAYVACLRGDLDNARTHSKAAYELTCAGKPPKTAAAFRAATNHAAVLTAREEFVAARPVLTLAMQGFRAHASIRASYADKSRWRFDPVQRLLREHGRFEDVAYVIRALPASDLLLSEVAAGEAQRLEGDLKGALAFEREYLDFFIRRSALASGAKRSLDWAHHALRRAGLLAEIGYEDEALAEILDVLSSIDSSKRIRGIRRIRTRVAPLVLQAMEEAARAMLRRGQLAQGRGLAARAYEVHRGYGQTPERRALPPLDRHPEHLDVHAVLEFRIPPLPPLASRAPATYARALLASGDAEEAVRIAEEALDELRGRVPDTSVRMGQAVHVLAQIQLEAGQAEAAHTHALAARGVLVAALGKDHPYLADVYITEGDAALRIRKSEAALRAYGRARDIARDALAPTHLVHALAYSGLAMAHLAADRPAEAVKAMREALSRVGLRLQRAFVGATNAARVSMRAAVQWALANWLQVCRAAGIDGYDDVRRLRGALSASLRDEAAIRRAAEGKAKAAAEALDLARRKLARAAHRAPRFGWGRQAWRRDLAELQADVEAKTKKLARASRPYAQEQKPRKDGAAALTSKLAKGAVLVDILLAGGHYVAWILEKGKAVRRVELGPEAEVDAQLDAFRTAVMEVASTRDPVLRKASLALRSGGWRALDAVVTDTTKRAFLVPDGAFAAAPLEALVYADGRTLLDLTQLVRLTEAADLMATRARLKGGGILLVGDVDFNLVERVQKGPVITGDSRKLLERVPGLTRFQRLPGTAAEVAWIEAEWKRRRSRVPRDLLVGSHAAETAVREKVRGKTVVHFATHGVVREDLNAKLRIPADEALRLRAGLVRHAQQMDPFLMTGLALSGVNLRTREGVDDGMLTALEVLDLDLSAAELAFLSACDTASGVSQAGEGVFGLVRAFRIAGARQVIASLWQVDDAATMALVKHFYGTYTPGSGTAPEAALRAAMQALRTQDRFQAPRYWAAFGVYGPPRR